jgi:hypothetical protein
MNNKQIVFLCGARDFHAMDWYYSAKELLDDTSKISIVTDLIQGEGFTKLVDSSDNVYKLIILDTLLFKTQSKLGDLWRNILKFFLLPIQVLLLRGFYKKNGDAIFFAHSMYYLWLAHFAGVDFVGTPQGSDLLIKPFKSKFFKYLSVKALRSAKFVTVDSEMMRAKCIQISGVDPFVIQNGIDLDSINKKVTHNVNEIKSNNTILSLRGLTDLYRINEILQSRNFNLKNIGIDFIYPFHDDTYKSKISFSKYDIDVGRVSRDKMYSLMKNASLVVSIPSSDSSPRSVYEAIFCNSIVAITYHKYYDDLPKCMQSRIIIVDIQNKDWLKVAFDKALYIKKKDFKPTVKALDLFDQKRSFNKKLNLLNSIK